MNFSKQIVNQNIDENRCFYGNTETSFINVSINDKNSGEYGFLDCKDIEVVNSNLAMKFLFRNNINLKVKNSNFNKESIDSIWNCNNVQLLALNVYSPRFIRYCTNITIDSCNIESDEFGWKSTNLKCNGSKIIGFCTFFEPIYSRIDNCEIKGKQAFETARNSIIENCYIESDDCFWHSENIQIRNCTIKSERLAWYSTNVTFYNCRIIGSQPICFSKNARLISCEFFECKNCFEQSEINGNIFGTIKSIKNPLCGYLVVDEMPEIIYTNKGNKNDYFNIRKYRNY